MSGPLLGVVLCGGRSTRMGTDKCLLTHEGGVSYLRHATSRLKPICDQVITSGASSPHPSIKNLPDPVPFRGPITGIVASLDFADSGYSACLFTPIDTPSLDSSDLQTLVDHWRRSGRVTIACSPQRQPLIGVYPCRFVDDLRRVASGPDRSVRRWLDSTDICEVPLGERACKNVNTPSDLPSGS